MRSHIYSVFDQATQAYLAPFTMRSDAEAARAFGEAVRNPQSNFSKFEKDFALYRIGSFDDNNGQVVGIQPPELVARAVEFVKYDAEGNSAVMPEKLSVRDRFEQESA